MNRCPITYDIISASESYSKPGLRMLSPKLKQLSQPLNKKNKNIYLRSLAGRSQRTCEF
jgi:hypothetical protein